MNQLMDDLPHLGELDNFSNLLRTHIVEVRPSKLFFLFNLGKHIFGNSLELSQGGL